MPPRNCRGSATAAVSGKTTRMPPSARSPSAACARLRPAPRCGLQRPRPDRSPARAGRSLELSEEIAAEIQHLVARQAGLSAKIAVRLVALQKEFGRLGRIAGGQPSEPVRARIEGMTVRHQFRQECPVVRRRRATGAASVAPWTSRRLAPHRFRLNADRRRARRHCDACTSAGRGQGVTFAAARRAGIRPQCGDGGSAMPRYQPRGQLPLHLGAIGCRDRIHALGAMARIVACRIVPQVVPPPS